MEELYSKASKIEKGYYYIATLRRGLQPLYRGGGHHHNQNTMNMDHLTLSLVEHTHHMHKYHCFICHKEGCSTRNYPGYNHGHLVDSWCANPKPSQTVNTRIVSTTSYLTPIPSHQDDLLDFFLKDVTKTQGHD